MAGDIRFRGYQLDAIRNIYSDCGLHPNGPADDEIVARCCSDGTRENGDHGRLGSELAEGASDDDLPPIRTEHPGDQVV